ncbi:MAG: hypothetical protein H6993_05320 [Pseudomonadales bacterium]|nr:hypothetical protein [Pseudomonadales bacterium]MCP5183361.1 hypothetical protein [Pseudomonadales bacterium]
MPDTLTTRRVQKRQLDAFGAEESFSVGNIWVVAQPRLSRQMTPVVSELTKLAGRFRENPILVNDNFDSLTITRRLTLELTNRPTQHNCSTRTAETDAVDENVTSCVRGSEDTDKADYWQKAISPTAQPPASVKSRSQRVSDTGFSVHCFCLLWDGRQYVCRGKPNLPSPCQKRHIREKGINDP